MPFEQIKLEITQPEAIARFMTTGTMPEPDGPLRPIYKFDLLHQPVELGPYRFEQWWIDRGKLYPTRNRSAPMYGPILNAFWDICRSASTHNDPEVQESFLLAKLLPHIRIQKAAEVFLDSVTHQRVDWAPKREAAEELELILSQGTEPMSIQRFHELTADLLGPPQYDDESWELYDVMAEQLLEQGRELLGASDTYADEAVNDVRKRWENWLTNIGRRHGKEHQKQMLDILSYESKAAFHRAYSTVWDKLVQVLKNNYGLDEPGRRFHRLWHTDKVQHSHEFPTQYAHRFHGHVFGLHPATALFISTPTGRSLIADYLLRDHEEPYTRMINGIALAITHYKSVYEQYQENRRK